MIHPLFYAWHLHLSRAKHRAPCAQHLNVTMAAISAVANVIWDQIRSTRSVSDDQMSILNFLFGKNFERATRIVDEGGVTRVSGFPSRRSLFLVVGESRRKEEYTCFPQHLCTCYSFFYDIVNRGDQICCKHQIAAQLADAVGAHQEVEVTDEQLALMLSKI